jgi:hypothetical protein
VESERERILGQMILNTPMGPAARNADGLLTVRDYLRDLLGRTWAKDDYDTWSLRDALLRARHVPAGSPERAAEELIVLAIRAL